ncbi:hypothetical protein FEAC_14850 [Ferrimicrobium acidiphilum DSM 19497]|jgi:hypothetical protein|uniref:Uncharacterized protein n=1 Tax=Ferrimicrobium acidiphilum DSM 19497 TaxID=1121877 RepID=A0A0D8FTT8_9ACTN|nr:hypothetical protein FEAC_14850 [Ferrimicrobium acidiphilum DSM 19497]
MKKERYESTDETTCATTCSFAVDQLLASSWDRKVNSIAAKKGQR